MRGLGRASIGWILEDSVVLWSGEGGNIGGWMNGIAERVGTTCKPSPQRLTLHNPICAALS